MNRALHREAVGMKIQELHSYIQEHQPNICQISVLQNGNELYSAEWNGYQRTDCVHITSSTKSVMALLIGIAIDHKMIGSVNDRVLSYFPEYSVKRGEKTIFDVTIRHLLTMRAPYSIYGIGWTTDLDGTFQKIASYLKKDGIFIFSWHHTLNYCIAWSCDERKDVIQNNNLVMNKSYFDESYFRMPVDGSEILLCNRKISTYVNALAKAGFAIEQMVEQTDEATMNAEGNISDKAKKAKMLPISVVFKARKL